MSVVSIVKCEDYDRERVREAVTRALELAGLAGKLSSAKRVLLKPNLLSTRKPEEAVTTHPEVVRAVAEICLRAGCEVSLGDSPPFAGQKAERYARLCESTGMSAVARELGIPLVRFEEDWTKLEHPRGRYYKGFEIARAVIDADLVINMPKLKTHGLTAFSGAIKNVFGCVPGIRKGLFHVQAAEDREVFAQMLVDLFAAIRPAVNVMDAIVAMEGEGPNAGRPKAVGAILASADAVALDSVSCDMVGINPMSVATTRLAREQGLGCGELAGIEILGEPLDDVRSDGFQPSSGRNEWARIPSPIRRMLRKQLVAWPVVSSSECAGCGDCSEGCPVKAITPGKPPVIDLQRCIRCYCCHEVCNYSAVSLRRGWLARLLLPRRNS